MNERPHVSICLTTYNRADALARTLQSLLQQTYRDFELIVCDDGSSDHTPAVMASVTDPRVRYIRHERNIGAYANWNSAIRASRGDYVAVYHDHDLYAPDLIERCVKVLDSDSRIGFVHFQKYILSAEGQVLTVTRVPFPALMEGRGLARYLAGAWDLRVGNFAMVRKSIFEQAGLIDETLRLAADYDLWGRLALASAWVGYIAEPLVGQMGRASDNPLASGRRYFWISTEENVANRRKLVERCYPTSSRRDRYERVRARIANDWHILVMLAQAVAHPSETSVSEGLAVVQRQGSAFAGPIAQFITRVAPTALMRSLASIYGSSYRSIKPWLYPFVVRVDEQPDVPWLK